MSHFIPRSLSSFPFSPIIFLANLPIFQYNHDIDASWHLLLYMQAIFSHLTGSCNSYVQFFDDFHDHFHIYTLKR